ncbi:MAG TPA: tRNA (adenosine(37)-N6)-threonylcarbamoyltransferase complex dimerization subunit type 1 TsaB [Acidisarcina sp.]|nr:tRNA (adenosine(37)-N6)-threonylcarbamoyltransferase complex dimerization subunit type 1 TsaB [Acidisarcina sp.]
MIDHARILLFDTCGSEGGVVLAEVRSGQAKTLAEATIAGKTFAAELIPAISGLLQRANLRLADLDALAVVHGPGSFTGVRIGVSTAKGLVEAEAIPLIAISRLAVLDRLSGVQGRTLAILDAGRGEFYAGIYEQRKRIHEALMTRDEVLAAAAGQPATLLVCEESSQAAFAALTPVVLAPPAPAAALPLALERLEARDFDDPALLDGNYLRRSDAEIFSRQARDMEARRRSMDAASQNPVPDEPAS